MSTVGGVYVSVTGEGWERSLASTAAMLASGGTENEWASAAVQASAALAAAVLGRTDDALRWLVATMPAIERAPGSAPAYPMGLAYLAGTLEELGRTDHIKTLERRRTSVATLVFSM